MHRTYVSRYLFKTSVPAMVLTREQWRELAGKGWRLKAPVLPLEPIDDPKFEVCRRERCTRPGVHAEGSCNEDAPRPKKNITPAESRKANTKQGYTVPYTVIRYEYHRSGKVAIVACPTCEGPGNDCRSCWGEGSVPLWKWHQIKAAPPKRK